MQKVGIATMTGGANYGNVLQNYAVQTLIERCGYEALTLNNQTRNGFPNVARQEPPLWRKLTPRYMAAWLRTKLGNLYGCKNTRDCVGLGLLRARRQSAEYKAAAERRMRRFEECRERVLRRDSVPMSAQRLPREHLAEFAAFVCGSDQVWNPYFHTNSMIEFLQFAPRHKRIALAPSFGVSELPESRKRDWAEWIASIPHLSVREDAGARLIRELTGREAQVLLDPTFALTPEDWYAFAREPKQKPDRDYVFCYFLGNETNRYVRYIRAYAEKYNCEIVDVCDIHDLRWYDVDPQEFVWLLANARAVFTDSFHGTAFSINLRKPFVVFERVEGGASMSSRIASVLDKTGLQNRKYPCVSVDAVDDIDFQNAQAVVVAERQVTLDYLQAALEAAVHGAEEPVLATRSHCTGCAACVNACPCGAIRMEPDGEGFSYPRIDPTHCISCRACERACPANAVTPPERGPEAYYGYACDALTCRGSSSGGVFSVLAAEILRQGGVVYGAGYDDTFRVCHRRIDRAEDLHQLRTSKYVQSDIGKTFCETRELLKQEVPVLFSGTPCQIAALRQFLGREYEKLYTQDIVCHGVPSPEVWQQYLKECHGSRQPAFVSFRDKTLGWNDFSMRINYADGTSYRELATKDPYERAFLANLTLRPSCYQCQYKTVSRVSDLTLADYWGVELVHPELKEQQGVSLVLIHSEKGRELWNAAQSKLVSGPTDGERAIRMNHAATHSVPWHRNRELFFERIGNEPLAGLVERCLREPTGRRIYRFVRRAGSKVKRLLKRMTGA